MKSVNVTKVDGGYIITFNSSGEQKVGVVVKQTVVLESIKKFFEDTPATVA